MVRSVTARAPGKLILSGEHAVVYGKPALAMAINRYAETTISARNPSEILFDLLNLKYKRAHSLAKLRKLKDRLHLEYESFQRGEHHIRDVLKKPFELLQYTATNLLDKLELTMAEGIKIHTNSTIPIGCGMGSSAATVVSTNHALSQFHHYPLALQQHIELGVAAENLQHGYSSGLDLQLAIRGGCLYFLRGEIASRPAPHFPMQIVNTGTPTSTTGECVKAAALVFSESSIADDFEIVTNAIDQILVNNNTTELKRLIRENHRLLIQIGVVPAKVQAFINEIEEHGGAAKICGAGSITGDNAGIVLVIHEEKIDQLAAKYGYPVESIEFEPEGVKIV